MERRPPKNQFGYALLVFVLAIMGAGGLLLVGFSEGMLDAAESKKFEHNKRVLKEAKQALLQFAYNYPVTNDKGPGRLPCADTDNDGIPNTCNSFGRFPWAQQNLNFYDIRDADGERLWYAVSSKFFTQATSVNSDTSGNITLRDQSGNIIYDGSNPGSLTQYGIAAVIIAPGAAIVRNDDFAQDRTVANVNAKKHYLDNTDDEDNAILNLNFSDSGDGFILGPVPNLTNDQFIVITAAEVIEMAEKATLQAYRKAIEDYRTNTGECVGELPDGAATQTLCESAVITPGTWTAVGGTGKCDGELPDGAATQALCESTIITAGTWNIGPYPWLYNYDVPASEAVSSFYPVLIPFDGVGGEKDTYLGNVGRIPRILGDHFTEAGSPPFETKFSGLISLDGPATVGGTSFLDGPALVYQTANKLTDVSFADIADVVGKDGRLTGTMTTPETFTYEVYFWEWDHDEPFMGGWSVCGDDGDGIPEVTDCNRDSSLNSTPGVLNDRRLDIIRLTIELVLEDEVSFDMDYTNPPVISPPVAATGTSHASITGTYADVISRPSNLTATWERYQHYHEGESVFQTSGSGTSNGTWNAAEMDNFGNGPLSLELRFYPEFPEWVFDNDWHDSVMMAYAEGYRPGGTGTCTPGDSDPAVACLQINGLGGINNDKVSILVIAGEHGWVDGDLTPPVPADTLLDNDVGDVFNLENSNLDNIFDMRTVEDTDAPGDTRRDKILVIE
jgi:type II secretory pathway pseudopilin PulG